MHRVHTMMKKYDVSYFWRIYYCYQNQSNNNKYVVALNKSFYKPLIWKLGGTWDIKSIKEPHLSKKKLISLGIGWISVDFNKDFPGIVERITGWFATLIDDDLCLRVKNYMTCVLKASVTPTRCSFNSFFCVTKVVLVVAFKFIWDVKRSKSMMALLFC